MNKQNSSLNESHLVKQDHNCSICLTAYYHPVQLVSCKHIFCQNCIEDTVILTGDRRCPLCRTFYGPHQVHKATKLWEEIQALYPNVVQEKNKTIKTKKLVYLKIGNRTITRQEQQGNKYEWTLFVKTAQGQQPLSKFAKKVEVKLHPTFPQNRLVYDMTNRQQIQLTRIGWGTFRIDIIIFWKDMFEEVSTEFFHDLDFRPAIEKQIGCYLHQKKQQAK